MTDQTTTPAEAEHLTYDVQERTIYDANGLMVAQNVNGADAGLFIFADRLRAATVALMAIPYIGAGGEDSAEAVDRVTAVLDEITAYQAKGAADSKREALQAPTRMDLIAEALAYEAPKFDRPEEGTWDVVIEGFGQSPDQAVQTGIATEAEARKIAETLTDQHGQHHYINGPLDGSELNVSGADLVDWFADWRLRMRATFGEPEIGPNTLILSPETYAAITEPAPSKITAYEKAIISNLIGAVDSLDHEVGQMEGMFTDEDGNTAEAREAGDEAVAEAQAFLQAVEVEAEPADARLREHLSEITELLDDAITTHIYDEQNGDEIPEDSDYVLAVDKSRVLLETTADAPKRTIYIALEGGLITSIYSPDDCDDLQVTTIDYDTDDLDRDDATMVDQGEGEFTVACVNAGQSIDRAPANVFADADEERFDADWED